MEDEIFRDLLDWFMVSDPWLLSIEQQERLSAWLSAESRKRGYPDWVSAYHSWKPKREEG